MREKKIAVYGFGGHAREVAFQMGVDVDFFVDEEYVLDGVKSIKEFNPEEYKIIVAIADSRLRKKAVDRLPAGTDFFTFIHPTSIVSEDFKIGKGSFIGAHSILTTNIKIGDHAIINRGNQIGHDCLIGDYFSIMPGGIVGGNVEIGNEVYLGSCSNVREKIKISSEVVVGMNSAVVKDITEPGIYVGVPSKKIK